MTAPTDRGSAQAMLVLEVPDALGVHEALATQGAEVLAPVFSPPWGGHRFFVRDPDS
jgi:hypothetical protein